MRHECVAAAIAAIIMAVSALPASVLASPQVEVVATVGSAIEMGGRRTETAPGFLAPRLAILSRGPEPGGSVAFLGGVSVPVSIDGATIGIQPGLGVLWRPTVDIAYGISASAIFGVEPVSFGVIEGAAEGRYYLTVGYAVKAEIALDYVMAEESRTLLGAMVGLVIDFDLAGAGT